MITFDPEIYDAALRNVIRKNQLAADKLTEDQFVSALKQALECGDFMRYVCVSESTQRVAYEPFRAVNALKARIADLEKLCELHGISAKELLDQSNDYHNT